MYQGNSNNGRHVRVYPPAQNETSSRTSGRSSCLFPLCYRSAILKEVLGDDPDPDHTCYCCCGAAEGVVRVVWRWGRTSRTKKFKRELTRESRHCEWDHIKMLPRDATSRPIT